MNNLVNIKKLQVCLIFKWKNSTFLRDMSPIREGSNPLPPFFPDKMYKIFSMPWNFSLLSPLVWVRFCLSLRLKYYHILHKLHYIYILQLHMICQHLSTRELIFYLYSLKGHVPLNYIFLNSWCWKPGNLHTDT